MTTAYQPIYKEFFKEYGYSWEDIDQEIYPILLKEEGYRKEEIHREMDYIKKMGLSLRF